MWPVILRELRAGSRRWTTYWLRLLGAGTVVAMITWWLSTRASVVVRQPGREVFLVIHRIVLASIWILVPLMAADCLSREKREGTLGLLFLTNLRAWNIVFAKAAAIGLTALTLWLSVVPVITVPVLLGGLPVAEIALSCSLALGSICVALAAGLLASAASRRASEAVSVALCLAIVGHLFYCEAVNDLFYWLAGVSSAPARPLPSQFQLIFYNIVTVWNLHAPTLVTVWGGAARGPALPLNGAVFAIPLFAFLTSSVCCLLASLLIRRNWQDKPKTKRQTDVENFFCAPVFWTGLFRWWMRRSLNRNPIGWLERRSWTGRITAWIALAIMISFASAFAYAPATRDDYESFDALMWMLLIGMAYVSAASFRRERETGAMELILVTPLSERQIISGRLRGLWNQYLPTFFVWVAVVLYLSTALKDWRAESLLRFSAAFLSVPVVGLYFSLRNRFLLLAWIATLVVAFAGPRLVEFCVRLLAATFGLLTEPPYFTDTNGRNGLARIFPLVYGLLGQILRYPFAVAVLAQLGLAALFLWRLQVNLRHRSFSLR